jgi:hypothetical protein
MEENKLTLKNKIREQLPHLKEVNKGCIINSSYYGLAELIHYDAEYYNYLFVDKTLQYRSDNERNIEIIGHPIKLNDVLAYINKVNSFEEGIFYYCSADTSENNEWGLDFENSLKDYKTIFKDIYFDEEEGYHPDYDGDILYKAIVKTSINETKDGFYNHRFVINPKEFVLRYWDLSSNFLADQSDELIDFLNKL